MTNNLWIPHTGGCTDTIAETFGRAIKAMQHVVDDLNSRARDGVVPIGNGAWWELNETLTELKKLRGEV